MAQRISFLLATCLLISNITSAQTAADYAIQLTAFTQQVPPQISLQWKRPAGVSTSYIVYRKAKQATSWTNLATIPSTDSIYIDNNVIVDSAYEYRIAVQGNSTIGGYMYAGINEKPMHRRGTMILLVDTLFKDSCKTEISTLINDLRGDGWRVIRHDISRNDTVTNIKSLIVNDYQSNGNTTAVLILGHIPVPYSGNLNPDGHPEHQGAWPADVYYGDMNGIWTDASVNNTAASRNENKNIPGDGKFDQTLIPSDIELQVGRIDFANMPTFAKTEIEMMRSYLNKDHLYKMDSLAIIKRGLIDDNFGAFSGEAFAANAWRNYAPIVGVDSIRSVDFMTTLNTANYQWAYGCGAGTYTSASGIGNTNGFKGKKVQSIFTMLFGSYFGDWDANNNFLRAPLCADEPALTSVWAGRPNWYFHHMALGENIGYAARLSQNNNLYTPQGAGARWVHAALMGDLSLRTDYINPAGSITINPVVNMGASLNWTASADASVTSYYVYRSDSLDGVYQCISPMISGLSFSDTVGTNGKKYYMVRPVKLQQTPSGAYYNLGIGIVDSAIVSYPLSVGDVVGNELNMQLYPNPATTELNLTITSIYEGTARLLITDLNGRSIMQVDQRLQRGRNNCSLNIFSLVPGHYFISLQNSKGRIIKLLSKQ